MAKTETQKRIDKAQKEYDDLAEQAGKLKNADKKFEAEVRDEIKRRRGDRDVDHAAIVKLKGEAFKELHDARQQRIGEIVASVDKGSTTPENATAELVTLGHTPASAAIEISRALKQSLSNKSPEPASSIITAPVPEMETRPTPEALPPLKVIDPISGILPVSRAVVITEPAPKK